jgi:hypothetical protein
MNDFGNLLGTPYPPVSKIAPVKGQKIKLASFGSRNPMFFDCWRWQQ